MESLDGRYKVQPMNSSPPSDSIIIEGEYCTIYPYDKSQHSEDLGKGLLNECIWTFTYKNQVAEREPRTEEEVISFIESLNEQFYVIKKKGTDKTLGCFTLMHDLPTQRCEVAYVLYSKQLQKTVIGTQAVFLLMKYAFQELNFNKCFWRCHTYNLPSKSAALRYGMKHQMMLRENLFHRKTYRNTEFYSTLKYEWPVFRSEFERWLEKENFDENGEQVTKLRCREIREEMDRRQS